jgi:dephospho-CoA kinase
MDSVDRRVVILGRGGAGKSTFAARLGAVTGIPVIELDTVFWRADLTPDTARRVGGMAARAGRPAGLNRGR